MRNYCFNRFTLRTDNIEPAVKFFAGWRSIIVCTNISHRKTGFAAGLSHASLSLWLHFVI